MPAAQEAAAAPRRIRDGHLLVSRTDPAGIIVSVNEAFTTLSGFDRDQLIGKAHSIVRHPETPTVVFREMWNTLLAGRSWTGTLKNRCGDGGHFWARSLIVPIRDADILSGYLAVYSPLEPADDAGRDQACRGLAARLEWLLAPPRLRGVTALGLGSMAAAHAGSVLGAGDVVTWLAWLPVAYTAVAAMSLYALLTRGILDRWVDRLGPARGAGAADDPAGGLVARARLHLACEDIGRAQADVLRQLRWLQDHVDALRAPPPPGRAANGLPAVDCVATTRIQVADLALYIDREVRSGDAGLAAARAAADACDAGLADALAGHRQLGHIRTELWHGVQQCEDTIHRLRAIAEATVRLSAAGPATGNGDTAGRLAAAEQVSILAREAAQCLAQATTGLERVASRTGSALAVVDRLGDGLRSGRGLIDALRHQFDLIDRHHQDALRGVVRISNATLDQELPLRDLARRIDCLAAATHRVRRSAQTLRFATDVHAPS